MAQTLTPFEEKLFEIIESHWADGGTTMGQAIAEIKAAVLAEFPDERIDTGTDESEYDYCGGYNQAIKEITEKIK